MANWITFNTTGGTGAQNVLVTAAPSTGDARELTFTVRTTGGLERILTVRQNAYVPPVAGNQILYTSKNGRIVTPYTTTGWTANIISNTYVDGQGCIEFDDEITSIPEKAFFSRSGTLESVYIPSGVTSIGEWAFNECASLTGITIPDSVTSIGGTAFSYCTSLTGITIPSGVTIINSGTFSNCRAITNITIPDSVTSIGDYAFMSCISLTGITIPDSVTSIGEWAFYECISLTGITIPDSVTSIGERTFYNCTSLTGITIPDSVTSIGDYAFQYCQNLSSITIPDSVTSIGEWAFHMCTSLTGITIPDSVTSIGKWAFKYCTSLTGITIPDSVTSIGEWAFENCTSLTGVTIPDSVTSIGDGAFMGCISLTGVTMQRATPPTLGSYVFDNTNNCPIYVPCGCGNTYKAATGWSAYASRIFEDCPEPSTYTLSNELDYPVDVRVYDPDRSRYDVTGVTLDHHDSVSWEGDDRVRLEIKADRNGNVLINDAEIGETLDGVTLVSGEYVQSHVIALYDGIRLSLRSAVALTVDNPNATGEEIEETNLEEILEENDNQELQDTL